MKSKMSNKKKIVFLGASITQGKISKSFVKILKDRLGTKQYKFVNRGVAGFEAYNVLNNLDKAVKASPDFVIILVGTNDILSSLNPELAKVSRKLKKIPHEPTLHFYSLHITSIIKRLKHETRAKIAVASLPVIGEDLTSVENKTVDEYNRELKKITETEGITYLPVHERQKKYLMDKIQGRGKDSTNSTKMAFKALFLHYLLFMSFDNISKRNGFLLLTDGIHQNSLGAKIIADEIEKFIKPV